jgi:hypothetical protein
LHGAPRAGGPPQDPDADSVAQRPLESTGRGRYKTGGAEEAAMKKIPQGIMCAALVGVLVGGGCAGLGARTIATDRFDYTAAIADSWKSQMLLNVVKIRYGDAPIFLDVAQVVNSYEISGKASLGGDWKFKPDYASAMNAQADLVTANKPTITYTPLSGEKFARSMMTPIPPSSILYLIQSGYPADTVLRGLVQSVNGARNRFGGSSAPRAADPEFLRLAEHLRNIQATGALGLRVQKDGTSERNMMVFRGRVDDRSQADVAQIEEILGLDPAVPEFSIYYGLSSTNKTEIAMLTRSLYLVLIDLASYVEVPQADVAQRRVGPGVPGEDLKDPSSQPTVRIHCAERKPADAFAAVPYGGHWFWIDACDLPSKRAFSFLMFAFSLVETGKREDVPIVTIPAR